MTKWTDFQPRNGENTINGNSAFFLQINNIFREDRFIFFFFLQNFTYRKNPLVRKSTWPEKDCFQTILLTIFKLTKKKIIDKIKIFTDLLGYHLLLL